MFKNSQAKGVEQPERKSMLGPDETRRQRLWVAPLWGMRRGTISDVRTSGDVRADELGTEDWCEGGYGRLGGYMESCWV